MADDSQRPDDPAPTPTGVTTRHETVTAVRAGQAGLLAALIMLAVQMIWRINWSENGAVQAFPEFIVAAVSRLTPLSVFGAATENYGSLAKKTLFVSVLLGIVAVGFRAGDAAGWLSGRIGRGALGRVAAGLLVAGALWLFTMLVILPIAYLGAFASASSYTGDILLQTTVTFALFGLVWAALATPRPAELAEETDMFGETISRRSVLGRGAWGAATLAAFAAVGGSTWRLFNPRQAKVNAAAPAAPSVNDIVATQRALQGNPLPTATATEAAPTPREEAALRSDVALQETVDPIDLFAQLDGEGKVTPVLTSNEDFYHVSKNLSDPTVASEGWALKVTGLVNQELELSYDEVFAMGTQQKITTLCCISNELNGDLIGTAQWTGFPLKDLLDRAGVKPGAIDIKFKAADDYEDSIPLDRALDPDTIVVVGMNGVPLPADHGFPARMIIPGIYGMKNVKWLQQIEVVDEDFQGYWQTRGWSDPAIVQIWGRIDQPEDDIDAGAFTATGVAFAGDRDTPRVEVSLDDGETWADAILEPALNPPFTWVRWAHPFDAQEGDYAMKIRATDGTGQVMSEEERSPLPDGATGWPRRSFDVEG